VARLLSDAGIVRNRAKIAAVIYNAEQVETLQLEFGSFKAWLDEHGKLELDQWVRLFKQTFKFTGTEITREFLVSTGYLPGAHATDCPIAVIVQTTATPQNRTQF
jgi:DNA-3-methyladenine glycosylase I